MENRKPRVMPPYMIYGMLALGLVSAFSFRVIIVLERVEPLWVRPAWYLGAGGYVFFFFYRYMITRRRKRAIGDYRLLEKLKGGEPLSDEERSVVFYLLSSVKSSKEDINYVVIFALSVLAIVTDLFLWYLK
jgi:hypothetical protein